MIFSVIKFVLNKQQEDFKNNDTEDKPEKPNVIISALGWLFLIISIVLVVVPAILIARQCNPELKIRYSILAFFFADIYIFQWAIRKFIMHEPNYCEML